MATTNDPAAAAAAHHIEIERLLAKIHDDALRLLAMAETRGADRWGAVGSLGHMRESLAALAGERG